MRHWKQYVAQTFMILLGVITFGAGETNTIPDTANLLKQLAANPYDKTLLATLAKTAVGVSNAEDRARYVTVYCLGALATDDNDVAAKGKAYLAKSFPSSSYLKTLSIDNLGDACPVCQGGGKVEGACSACNGSGKCTTCRGTGSVKRSGYSGGRFVENTGNCTDCRGSGECKECKGRGKATKTCTRCAGGGKVWSVSRIKEEYLAMLKAPVASGTRVGGNLGFSDVTGKAGESPAVGSPPSLVNQVRRVEVEGTGATADDALKDAFSSAVKSCIGVMVNAEQVVENEEVIKDEILTYSNGYIKDYDDLGSAKKSGLIVRRIRATVILGKLASKLRDKNITVNEIKGEALFAEAVTVNQERTDFKTMLAKVLSDYDPKKLWAPQLIERKIISQDENAATVAFCITVIPNKVAIAQFFAVFEKLLNTKYTQQRLQLVQYDNGHTHEYRMAEGLLGSGCVRVGTKDELPFNYFPKAGNMILFVNRAASRVLTSEEKQDRDNSGIDRVYTELSCLAYRIPTDDWKTYFKDCYVFTSDDGPVNSKGSAYLHHSQAVPYILAVLKDSQGNDIDFFESEVDFSLIGRAGFGWSGPYGRGLESWIILLHGESYPPEQYKSIRGYGDIFHKRKPLVVEKTFTIDELRRIKTVELSLELRGTGEQSIMKRGTVARTLKAHESVFANKAENLDNAPVALAREVMRVGTAELDNGDAVGAGDRRSVAAQERHTESSVAMVQETMHKGTEALDKKTAIGSDVGDSEKSKQAETKALVETAKEGQEKTVGLLKQDGKTSLCVGEILGAVGFIALCVIVVRYGKLVRFVVVAILGRFLAKR